MYSPAYLLVEILKILCYTHILWRHSVTSFCEVIVNLLWKAMSMFKSLQIKEMKSNFALGKPVTCLWIYILMLLRIFTHDTSLGPGTLCWIYVWGGNFEFWRKRFLGQGWGLFIKNVWTLPYKRIQNQYAQVIAIALFSLQEEAFITSGAVDKTAWKDERCRENNNFFFWNLILDLQMTILLLIRWAG